MKHKIVIEFETTDELTQEQCDLIQEIAADASAQVESLNERDVVKEGCSVDYKNLIHSYSNDLSDKIDRHILGVYDE